MNKILYLFISADS